MQVKVEGIKHSSLRVTTPSGTIIYIDPWELPDHAVKADLILVSHIHRDHCSPADLGALSQPATRVVAAAATVSKIVAESELSNDQVLAIEAGQQHTVGGVTVRAVYAHNINKWRNPGEPFHPKDPSFCGFVIEAEGARIYYAGDTDVCAPEATGVDVAIIPVSGTYVMSAEEAAQAVSQLKPRLAVPVHYGSVVGTRADAERFRDLVAPVPVQIPF